jgi:outer membrane protein assembly factor BamE (lipoprotein component of BamABCDE complex)
MAWLQLILALGMLVSGCDRMLYPRFEKSMWTTYIQLQDVRPGMEVSEVEGIMGPPGIKEEGDYRGGHYLFYFYLTHSMDYEGGGNRAQRLHAPGLPTGPFGGHRQTGLPGRSGPSRGG